MPREKLMPQWFFPPLPPFSHPRLPKRAGWSRFLQGAHPFAVPSRFLFYFILLLLFQGTHARGLFLGGLVGTYGLCTLGTTYVGPCRPGRRPKGGAGPAAVSPYEQAEWESIGPTRRYETGLPEVVTAGSAAGIRKAVLRDILYGVVYVRMYVRVYVCMTCRLTAASKPRCTMLSAITYATEPVSRSHVCATRHISR
ncbi:hypothetical protein F4813DRAFT_342808 [Daldinia decipiens]|uniref:uncharacterized protein n=1 Tax=Daldinia decipiens TaxID=326647 RepID=UPI0020C43D76|nr:uncharacterized protein F4813DRAFT_342808 [Daldinia decipiens]KAI1663050.1 hypothetical protein F4813DRAFT_342808 [Daldinia decipiens]